MYGILSTKAGGITGATIRALGAEFPLKAGWRKAIIGKMVSRDNFRAALEGRSIYH